MINVNSNGHSHSNSIVYFYRLYKAFFIWKEKPQSRLIFFCVFDIIMLWIKEVIKYASNYVGGWNGL